MTDVQKEGRDLASLPADIYHILSDETDHEVSEENVEWAGELLKQLLRTRLVKRKEKRGEEVLRFSALGKQDRQLWYMANMPEKAEKLDGKTHFKFLYGDVLELLLLFLAKEAGHSVEYAQEEVSEDGVLGHVDAVIDGVLTDAKSASPYGYNKFRTGDILFDDSFGYIPQLAGYHHAISAKLPGVIDESRAAFLACDKVSGDICVMEIDKETLDGNPPGPRIKHLKEVIGRKQPPPRCYSPVPEGKSGNLKLDLGCSYCAYRDECWSDANDGRGLRKFVYSRGPVWLTSVKKEPKVDEAM